MATTVVTPSTFGDPSSHVSLTPTRSATRASWLSLKALIVREMTFRDRIQHEDLDRFVAEVNSSADAKEGMAARLAKRPANFQGR